MRQIQKYIRLVTNILSYIGMGMLVALMLIGAFDVIGRYFFNHPIKGAYEISEVLLAGIVFFGLAYALSVGGHVKVDTFVVLMGRRKKALVGIATSALSLIIFVLIGWQGMELAIKSWHNHRLIDVIYLPIAPFQMFVPLGISVLCLELFLELLKNIEQLRKEN